MDGSSRGHGCGRDRKGKQPQLDDTYIDTSDDTLEESKGEEGGDGPRHDGNGGENQPQYTYERKKSWVWEYLDKRMVDGGLRAFCKLCGTANFSCSIIGGTGHLARHLTKCLAKHGQKHTSQSQIQGTSNPCEWGTFRFWCRLRIGRSQWRR